MPRAKEPPTSYEKTLDQARNKEERIAMVRKAMEDGHSNKSAAQALGTTPGTIAGIRNTAKIPSTHEPSHGKAIEQPAPTEVRPRPKLAASESTQCVAEVDGIRCAYERLPGKYRCALHINKR